MRDRVAPERIVYKVNTVLGLAEAVESGIGIGPLPCFIADVRPALVRLTPPNPDFSAGLWLLTHPDLRQSARVRAFMDFVAAEISQAAARRSIEGAARAALEAEVRRRPARLSRSPRPPGRAPCRR